MDYLELTVAVRPEAVEAAAELLQRHIPAGVSIEQPYEILEEEAGVAFDGAAPVRLRAWLPTNGANGNKALAGLRHDVRGLGDAIIRPLRARRVQDGAWGERWKRFFPVLRIGRALVIKPSWRCYRPRGGDAVIELDPGLAFGTGQHATTRMCLEALEERLAPNAHVLDLGSGSGVLSLAAALLGAARVDALDIDPDAVDATRRNATANGVERVVRAAQGSLGEAWPFAEPPAYDLVLANLSGRIVRELAREIVGALQPGGVALVSGIIAEHEGVCRDALRVAGGDVVETRSDEDWRMVEVRSGLASINVALMGETINVN